MQHEGMDAEAVFDLVHRALASDSCPDRNLATFCQTWADEEVQQLMINGMGKNLMNREEYPATAMLEHQCMHMIADLWHVPSLDDLAGCATVGSSEAAMLGGLALKRLWQAKQRVRGRSVNRPNLVIGSAQVCWRKFARHFDVELREIPMTLNSLNPSPEKVVSWVDENTIGVVATLGMTLTGRYDQIVEISSSLDQVESQRGLDIPVHVDAASGGFLAPFVEPDMNWDFRLPRVRSINASGHKFGLAPLGIGWIIWRNQSSRPKDLVFWVNYLGGNMPDCGLNFSRPSGQVIAQYYLLKRLGRKGYRDIHLESYRLVAELADGLERLGLFTLLFNGNSKQGIPAVCWILKDGLNLKFTLYDLSHELRRQGWEVAVYELVPELESLTVARALVRHGFTSDLVTIFLADVRCAVHHLLSQDNADT